MVVLKNTLACVVAFAGIVASAAGDASTSDCSSTLPIVTQGAGTTTSDGTLLSTWSMCTVVQQTHCESFTTAGGQTTPASPASTTSVSGEVPPSSYGGDEGYSSTNNGQSEGSLSVKVVSTAAGATQPGYTAPATSVPGQGSIPPGETPTAVTAGASSGTVNTAATGSQVGSASYPNTETNPTGTNSESYTTGPSGATGTPPTTTATGAASVHNAVPAALLGVAGMVAAIIF